MNAYKEYIVRLSADEIFIWRYVTTARNKTEAIHRAKIIVSMTANIQQEKLSVIEVIEKDENSLHN